MTNSIKGMPLFWCSALVIIFIAAIFAPALAPFNPIEQLDIVGLKNMAPNQIFLFGTDQFSRDVFSRMLFGARTTLGVALGATAISVAVGSVYGLIAGYYGGTADQLMMRGVDILMSIPRLLIVILIAALWNGMPITTLILILGLSGWFGISRLVRSKVISVRREDYILAAESVGADGTRIITKHILPNIAPTIIVCTTLALAQFIVMEAGLSFLGIGIQPPTPSWGNILRDGMSDLGRQWWLSVIPGMFISVVAIAFNSLGDILRDHLEPRKQ